MFKKNQRVHVVRRHSEKMTGKIIEVRPSEGRGEWYVVCNDDKTRTLTVRKSHLTLA